LKDYSVSEPVAGAEWWPTELLIEDRAAETKEAVFKLGEFVYGANINKITDERGLLLGWDVVVRDITGVTSRINQLESLATTDSLTGIATRRHFLDRVTSELDMAGRLKLETALIMYDIDFFKNVNDTYGHAAGDYILCAVVEVIKQQLRSYDIFARYGGEEFVIFTLSSDNENSLGKFASRLRGAIENAKFAYEGNDIPVTASFGAVQILPGDNFNEAMLAVDEAMYKAKNSGRNQVVVGKIERNGRAPYDRGT
jgi:diguanylate cyclase (GGDEF)-like protein